MKRGRLIIVITKMETGSDCSLSSFDSPKKTRPSVVKETLRVSREKELSR